MSKNGKGQSGTRAVHYEFEGDFPEGPLERLLQSAVSKGVVTEFDTGRGRLVWFNGRPGAELREVKAQVKSLVDRGWDGSES